VCARGQRSVEADKNERISTRRPPASTSHFITRQFTACQPDKDVSEGHVTVTSPATGRCAFVYSVYSSTIASGVGVLSAPHSSLLDMVRPGRQRLDMRLARLAAPLVACVQRISCSSNRTLTPSAECHRNSNSLLWISQQQSVATATFSDGSKNSDVVLPTLQIQRRSLRWTSR